MSQYEMLQNRYAVHAQNNLQNLQEFQTVKYKSMATSVPKPCRAPRLLQMHKIGFKFDTHGIAWLFLAGLTVISFCLVQACPHSANRINDPELNRLLTVISPIECTSMDKLAASSPRQYAAAHAGRGIGSQLDFASACGCAEGATASGPTSPPTQPVIEQGSRHSKVRIQIRLPQSK